MADATEVKSKESVNVYGNRDTNLVKEMNEMK